MTRKNPTPKEIKIIDRQREKAYRPTNFDEPPGVLNLTLVPLFRRRGERYSYIYR